MTTNDFLHWTQDSLIRKGFYYIPSSHMITFNSDFAETSGLKLRGTELDAKMKRLLSYGQLDQTISLLAEIYGKEILEIYKRDPDIRFRLFMLRYGPEKKRYDRDDWLQRFPTPPVMPE